MKSLASRGPFGNWSAHLNSARWLEIAAAIEHVIKLPRAGGQKFDLIDEDREILIARGTGACLMLKAVNIATTEMTVRVLTFDVARDLIAQIRRVVR